MRKLHSKLPIFCVKSVKIYTGQKKFIRAPPVAPVTNMRYDITLIIMITTMTIFTGHPSSHPASRYLCTLQHRSLETVRSLGCCSPWLLWPSFFSFGCRFVVILPRYFLLFIMMMMMVFMFTNQYSCLELAIFVVEASSTPQAPLKLTHPLRNQKTGRSSL